MRNSVCGLLLLLWVVTLVSCVQEDRTLPILGERSVENGDTLYHTIPTFRFIDQDSTVITNNTFKGKIYVADFFFTSCRSICPVMKSQMVRVYEAIKDTTDVLLLSHTIDPDYDTIPLLHDYADRLGVSADHWHFVTGNKDSIYQIAAEGYFTPASEDENHPEGFIHNGAFMLIDKEGRVRGRYDGTKEEEVSRLIDDLQILRKEYQP